MGAPATISVTVPCFSPVGATPKPARRARYPLAIEHWTRGRVSTLTLLGLAIAALGLFVFGLSAPRGHGVYVPAHVENGVLVPGRIE